MRFSKDTPGSPDPRSDTYKHVEEAAKPPAREPSPQTARRTTANRRDRTESCIQVASEPVNERDEASPVREPPSLQGVLFPPSPTADDALRATREPTADHYQHTNFPNNPPASNDTSMHGIEQQNDSSSTDNTLVEDATATSGPDGYSLETVRQAISDQSNTSVEGSTGTSESDRNSLETVRQVIPDQSNTQLQYGVFAVPQEEANAYFSTGAHNVNVPIPEQFIQLKPDDTEARVFVPVATMAEADGLVQMQVEYTTNPQQQTHGMLRTATQTSEPSIGIVFVLILSRAPLYRSAEWKPKGKFLSKSFAQLQAELPQELQEGAQGLLFRLSGNGVDTEQPVHFGRDGQFDVMKRFFKRQIQSARAQNRGAEMLPFEIEIEPLVEDITRGVDEDDDLF